MSGKYALLYRLVPYLRPHWLTLVIGTLLALAVSVAEGAIAWLVKPAMDGAPLPKQLRACLTTDAGARIDLGTTSVAADGRWTFKVASDFSAPARIQVTAIGENGQAGATATITITGPSSAEKLVTQSDQSASSGSP